MSVHTRESCPINHGALAKMVMLLLDHWNLPTADHLFLLGLPPSNRATLKKYRQGAPIDGSRDQYDRLGHLIGIHKNLRLLFPRNPEYRYGWMKTKNKAFENRTPVELVKEFGFIGLLMVRSYLDRSRLH